MTEDKEKLNNRKSIAKRDLVVTGISEKTLVRLHNYYYLEEHKDKTFRKAKYVYRT